MANKKAQNYDASVAQLLSIDADAGNEAANLQNPLFVEELRETDFNLGLKEIDEPGRTNRLETLTAHATAVIDEFATFKADLEARKKAYRSLGKPCEEWQNFLDSSDQVYKLALQFTNTLILDANNPQVEHIKMVRDVVASAKKVLANPRNSIARENLAANLANLDSQLETGAFWHAACVTGRALVGALGCLLGAAIIVAGLTTGIGLLLTLGCGLVTWGGHWGPLSWGKKLCIASFNYGTGGPSSNERASAQKISTQLVDMNKMAEAVPAEAKSPAP